MPDMAQQADELRLTCLDVHKCMRVANPGFGNFRPADSRKDPRVAIRLPTCRVGMSH